MRLVLPKDSIRHDKTHAQLRISRHRSGHDRSLPGRRLRQRDAYVCQGRKARTARKPGFEVAKESSDFAVVSTRATHVQTSMDMSVDCRC